VYQRPVNRRPLDILNRKYFDAESYFLQKFSGIFINSDCRCFLGYAVFVSWVLRDGLGPDAIDSNGLVAFQRFFKSFGPMLLIVSPIGVTGLWLTSPILRRNSRERKPQK
jgi:hypothetical protein